MLVSGCFCKDGYVLSDNQYCIKSASCNTDPDNYPTKGDPKGTGYTKGTDYPKGTGDRDNYPIKGGTNYPTKGDPGYPTKGGTNYPTKGDPSYPTKGYPSYPNKGGPNYPTKGDPKGTRYPINGDAESVGTNHWGQWTTCSKTCGSGTRSRIGYKESCQNQIFR